jgi:uncharacterized protein YbjT (DUF2867 family)
VLARDPARARADLDPAIDIVRGDLRKQDSLRAAMEGISDVIVSAGVRSGRPAREERIKATEYDGVLNTLAAATDARLPGRIMYMTSSGTARGSFWAFALNLYKGNTLVWRHRAEDAIRASGLTYTIIRAGVLLNRPAGTRAIEVTQRALPLSPRYRIARGDVAEAFAAALDHPRTACATFEVIWKNGDRREPWPKLFAALKPDRERGE